MRYLPIFDEMLATIVSSWIGSNGGELAFQDLQELMQRTQGWQFKKAQILETPQQLQETVAQNTPKAVLGIELRAKKAAAKPAKKNGKAKQQEKQRLMVVRCNGWTRLLLA